MLVCSVGTTYLVFTLLFTHPLSMQAMCVMIKDINYVLMTRGLWNSESLKYCKERTVTEWKAMSLEERALQIS